MTSGTVTNEQIYVQSKPWPAFAAKSQRQLKALQSEQLSQYSQHIEIPPPGSKKKLRESCNSCAISKVRCSKDQPVCVRCEERGLFCRYSLSRRTGKRGPSSSSSSPVSIDSTTRTLEAITTSDKIPFFDIHSSSHHLSPDDGGRCELFEFSRSGSISNSVSPTCSNTPIDKRSDLDVQSTRMCNNDLMIWDDNVLCTNFEGSAVDISKFDNSMSVSADFISTSYLDVDMLGYNEKSNIMAPTQSNYDSMSSILDTMGHESITRTVITMSPNCIPQDHHQQDRNTGKIAEAALVDLQYSDLHHNSQDCTILTLNMLQSLHLPPSDCQIIHPTMRKAQSLPQSRAMLSLSNIDNVVTTNKVIIDSMTNILKCQCSLDTDLTLILTLIASKIVERYSTVASRDRETDLQRQDPFSTEPYVGYYYTGSVNSASVGNYYLDAVIARKMRDQLVLSGLHRVMRLVEQLCRRSHGSANGGSSIGAQDAGSAGCQHRTAMMMGDLVTSLKDRIKIVMKDMTEVL